MSMTKGTPASSQIIWLEQRVKELDEEIERLREALRKIEDHHNEDEGWRELARAALQGDGE